MGFNTQAKLTGSGIAGQGKAFTADLWTDCDPQVYLRDPSAGVFKQDDFLFPPIVAANSGAGTVIGEYNAATGATAGTTIGAIAGQGGNVELQSTTDNEAAMLQWGQVAQRPFMLNTAPKTTAYPYAHLARLRFETRFLLNVSAITDEQAIFIGLAGVLALTDLADDTGQVAASKNFFGFHTLNAAPSTLRFIYQAAADSSPQVLIASVGTLVAKKWNTVGFDYNPTAPDNERGTIWFNGVKASTYLTKAQSEAATFPKSNDSTSVNLAPTWMRKSGDGTTSGLVLGGWRICEEYKVGSGNEACG